MEEVLSKTAYDETVRNGNKPSAFHKVSPYCSCGICHMAILESQTLRSNGYIHISEVRLPERIDVNYDKHKDSWHYAKAQNDTIDKLIELNPGIGVKR